MNFHMYDFALLKGFTQNDTSIIFLIIAASTGITSLIFGWFIVDYCKQYHTRKIWRIFSLFGRKKAKY